MQIHKIHSPNDDFQFWNHVNIHGQPYHCSGGRQDSEDHLN